MSVSQESSITIMAAPSPPAARSHPTATSASPSFVEIAIVFLIALALFAALTPRLTTILDPVSGDEPTYLMTTISLLKDGDFNECNNFRQRDEQGFYPPSYWQQGVARPQGYQGWPNMTYPLPVQWEQIEPLSRRCISTDPATPLPADGSQNEAYTWHGLGLSILIAPAYALGGRLAVVFFLNLLGALLAANIYLLVRETVNKRWIAILTVATFMLTLPIFPFIYLIFTELPAALLVIYAFRRIRLWQNTGVQTALVALSIASLPWLHYRYIPLAGILTLFYFYMSVRGKPKLATWLRHYATLPLVLLVSALGIFGWSYTLFHEFTIKAGYLERNDATDTILSGLGLFIDQRFGFLTTAPVFLLAGVGLIIMGLEKRWRLDLIVILAVAIPYLGLLANFKYWWGIWAPPARYFIAILPLFALPFALGFARISTLLPSLIYKLTYAGLLAVSLVQTAAFMFNPQDSFSFALNGFDLFKSLLLRIPNPGLQQWIETIPSNGLLPDFVFARSKAGFLSQGYSARNAVQESVPALTSIAAVLLLGLLLYWWAQRSYRPQLASSRVASAGSLPDVPAATQLVPMVQPGVAASLGETAGAAGAAVVEAEPATYVLPATIPIPPRWGLRHSLISLLAGLGLLIGSYLFYSYTFGLKDAYAQISEVPPAQFVPLTTTVPQGDYAIPIPLAIAADDQGNAYTADRENFTVTRINVDGKPAAHWRLFAELSESERGRLVSLLFTQGHLIALNTNGGMAVYDPDGKLLGNLNLNNAAQSYGSRGLCADPTGNIYLADTGGNRVIKLDNTGKLIAQFGNDNLERTVPKQLYQPIDCAVGSNGQIYVSDLKRRIAQFDREGNFQREWPLLGFEQETSLHLAAHGNILYVTSSERNRLIAINTDNGNARILGLPGGGAGQFQGLVDVATDPGGKVYTLESDSRRVQVFPPQ